MPQLNEFSWLVMSLKFFFMIFSLYLVNNYYNFSFTNVSNNLNFYFVSII